jgi:hypothetical protein
VKRRELTNKVFRGEIGRERKSSRKRRAAVKGGEYKENENEMRN